MILYLIGNYKKLNTGAGGHYYSLLEMAKQIGLQRNIKIFCFGSEPPLAFSDLSQIVHIKSSLLGQELAINKVRQYVINKEWDVEVVHAYDSNVAFIGLVLARMLTAKFCLTKCGGPVPRYFYPRAPHLFVFHPADYTHFKPKVRPYPNVTLLPNRVTRPFYDENRAQEIFGEKKNNCIVVFRIGRIGPMYKETILSSIRLVNSLNDRGVNSELKVIGYLESETVLAELKQVANNRVSFYTARESTINAAELLEYCDIVVGTGRGLLEALSSGRVVFFPVRNSMYPCLLTNESFKTGFAENFSERVELNSQIGDLALPDFFTPYLMSNMENLKTTSQELHKRYFDSKLGADYLVQYYKDMEYGPKCSWFSLFVHRTYLLYLAVSNVFR